METKPVSRREFMKIAGWAAGVTGFTAVAYPLVAYLYPKDLSETPAEPVLIGPPADLPVGTSKTVPYGRYPALVLNTPGGLRAYSAVCTHFACLVKYNPDTGRIECPCHAGFFNPDDGSVISGPPPKALTPFPVYVAEDGNVYVGEQQKKEEEAMP